MEAQWHVWSAVMVASLVSFLGCLPFSWVIATVGQGQWVVLEATAAELSCPVKAYKSCAPVCKPHSCPAWEKVWENCFMVVVQIQGALFWHWWSWLCSPVGHAMYIPLNVSLGYIFHKHVLFHHCMSEIYLAPKSMGITYQVDDIYASALQLSMTYALPSLVPPEIITTKPVCYIFG